MQDMDIAVQLGQWNPFLAWTPKEEVLFLPKLENQLLLRLHHCGAVRARVGVQWPATGSWQQQLRVINEADPLTTTQELAKELNVNHCTVIWYLKQIGKVKKLSKWVSYELTTNQKNCHFKMLSSLTLCNNNEPSLDQIMMYDKKWILNNENQCS